MIPKQHFKAKQLYSDSEKFVHTFSSSLQVLLFDFCFGLALKILQKPFSHFLYFATQAQVQLQGGRNGRGQWASEPAKVGKEVSQ